jgi:mannose-6-phosphate isomerase-like protein (cupin superfamily)
LRELVADLRDEGREEVIHRREHLRPWGSFEPLASGEAGGGYKIKRITVKPGESLSLQMHHKRQEHWVVVEGTAEVTRDDQVFTLSVGGSTHIPVGVRHRLHNPGLEPLILVEVQCGDYLGEDDIVRFEDRYGRS